MRAHVRGSNRKSLAALAELQVCLCLARGLTLTARLIVSNQMAANACEKSFAVENCYDSFYNGVDIHWSADGTQFYCLNTTEVTVVKVQTGQLVQKFSIIGDNVAALDARNEAEDGIEQDVIYSFALNEQRECLVTGHRSGLLRVWSLETREVIKLWKSQHNGPIVKVQFSACGNYICSSGADSVLRFWDYTNNRCVSALKDVPGPSQCIQFHPYAGKTEIYAAGSDHTVYCWNFVTKQCERQLRGHLSQVTAIAFRSETENCNHLFTVSRDKVFIVWQLQPLQQLKVIPIYEELVGISSLKTNADNDNMDVIVACSKGQLKFVDGNKAKIHDLCKVSESELKCLLFCKANNQVAVVTVEQNILIYNVSGTSEVSCMKQLIGCNDEIIDATFCGVSNRYLAVATTTNNFKVYDTLDNMNCKIINGHTEMVLVFSSHGSGKYLASAGKDFSILLWEIDEKAFEIKCIANMANSHTSTIGCVAFAENAVFQLASVAQDGSMKLWNLKQSKSKSFSFNLKHAAKAHDKEINSVTFSPNNKLIATASSDKTAKLWNSEELALVGVLRGHARMVYSVRFSPVDQVVVTTANDASVRLWSIVSLSCLKRFEQDCTVLRVEFIDHGKYFIAAQSDGLIKVWNIKTSTCIQTLQEHTNRVWAIAISGRSHKYFFSAGADSRLIKWRDSTNENRQSELEERMALLQQEQALLTLLHEEQNLTDAFQLALKLGKPKTTYKVISHFVRRRDNESIKRMVRSLNADQCNVLIEHVKGWCTNSRYCRIANIILQELLIRATSKSQEHNFNIANLVEVLSPYVQRHFKRFTEMNKELAFLEFVVNSI